MIGQQYPVVSEANVSKGAPLACDGFFPFDGSVCTAAAAGLKAIVQPGGSIRDEDSTKAANELGIVMAFTGSSAASRLKSGVDDLHKPYGIMLLAKAYPKIKR